MGIWAEHFHPRVLLRWIVLGWVIPTLLAVGGLMLAVDQFVFANICFSIAAAILIFKVIALAISYWERTIEAFLFVVVLCAVICFATTAAIRGVNRYGEKKAKGPDSQSPIANHGARVNEIPQVKATEPQVEVPNDHSVSRPKTEAEPLSHKERDKVLARIEAKYHTTHPQHGPLLDEQQWINTELVRDGYTSFRVKAVVPITGIPCQPALVTGDGAVIEDVSTLSVGPCSGVQLGNSAHIKGLQVVVTEKKHRDD